MGALLALAALLPACARMPTQPTAGGAPQPAGGNAPLPKAPAGPFSALLIDGLWYPLHQFTLATPDRCNASHWHANKPVYSIGRAGTIGDPLYPRSIACHEGMRFPSIADPDPGRCGFGKESDVVRTSELYVDERCWEEFVKVAPVP
jgi:hypothetical protein